MRALVFDTETTDLIRNRTKKAERQPHIIEFYGQIVDFSTGEVIEEYDALIKPPVPITPETTKITRITQEMVDAADPFATHAEAISTLFKKAPAVIAHNASFDRDMVELEFERLKLECPWPKVICTVEQTMHIKGYRLSLTALHDILFAEPFPEAHRAKQDVHALTRCCVELYRRGEL